MKYKCIVYFTLVVLVSVCDEFAIRLITSFKFSLHLFPKYDEMRLDILHNHLSFTTKNTIFINRMSTHTMYKYFIVNTIE